MARFTPIIEDKWRFIQQPWHNLRLNYATLVNRYGQWGKTYLDETCDNLGIDLSQDDIGFFGISNITYKGQHPGAAAGLLARLTQPTGPLDLDKVGAFSISREVLAAAASIALMLLISSFTAGIPAAAIFLGLTASLIISGVNRGGNFGSFTPLASVLGLPGLIFEGICTTVATIGVSLLTTMGVGVVAMIDGVRSCFADEPDEHAAEGQDMVDREQRQVGDNPEMREAFEAGHQFGQDFAHAVTQSENNGQSAVAQLLAHQFKPGAGHPTTASNTAMTGAATVGVVVPEPGQQQQTNKAPAGYTRPSSPGR